MGLWISSIIIESGESTPEQDLREAVDTLEPVPPLIRQDATVSRDGIHTFDETRSFNETSAYLEAVFDAY